MKRLSPKTWHWVRFATALAVVSVVAIGGSMLIASAVGATQDECNYRIQPRDTLSRIAARHSTTYQQLATRNGIADPNRIYVGDYIDICQPGPVPVAANRPVEIPGRAIDWAQAVADTKPDWATTHDVRFLVAVTKFESSWCQHIWNPGDAGGAYTGSFGCAQVRVLRNPAAYPADWFRDRDWLVQSYENQATASWLIWEARVARGQTGPSAWGPARHARGIGVKIPPNGDCTGAANRGSCEDAWRVADLALANIECRYPLVDFGDCP